MNIPRSFTDIKAALNKGSLTVTGLVQSYLDRIEADKNLNAWLEVFGAEALVQAQTLDGQLAEGKAGALAGMVIGLKDNLCLKDHKVSAGSKILEGFVSQYTAPAIQKLVDAGAIIIGRQNCDEFGMGSTNENSAYGAVLNAADTSRVPGGSSGGSAVAVQANHCTVSLGSDTGGSVRQPAAFTGIYGLKPTYGRISRFGLIAYASSFDTIGILGHTAEDIALVLEHMAGADGMDSTASTRSVPAYTQEIAGLAERTGLRIGILAQGLADAVAPAIKQGVEEVRQQLEAAGHVTEVVELKLLEYLLPTYYVLTAAESSSNLSRYDGVRYGYRSANATDLESMYKLSRGEAFGPEVKRRIMLGTFVLSANYYDAYFTKAQRVRRLIKEETEALMQQYDYVLMPVAADVAFKFGEKNADPLSMFLADVFTVQANVVGMPALAIPTSVQHEGMPVGLQLLGKAWDEAGLLALAKQLEAATMVD